VGLSPREGRRWWITATSDSHVHYTRGGSDFWPGEYAKTRVYAARSYDDILDGLRNGRIFVATGDLISELYVTAESRGRRASIGETLNLNDNGRAAREVTIEIVFKPLDGVNARGEHPEVKRVDLISGRIGGAVTDRMTDTNSTTQVVKRFAPGEWRRRGDVYVLTHTLRDVDGPMYLRVRGTSTTEEEPQPDVRGEDPWSDLWFYSNPVFVRPT